MPQRKKKEVNNNYKKYYSSTSEALDIKTSNEKEQIPKKRIRRVFKKFNKTKYKYEIDKKSNYSIITYLTVIIFFVCGVITLSFNANMSLLVLENENMLENLNVIREKNEIIKNEISNSYNLTEIADIASKRLGMTTPQPHQIIKIKVPKQTTTTVNNYKEKKESNSFFEDVKIFFGNIF